MPRPATKPKFVLDQILAGDARDVLPTIPANLVDCIVTSPPYFQQREYTRQATEIGQEQSPAEYVAALVDVFRKCRRILKPSGALWVVLGDKYHEGAQLGMPWRVALALVEDGWILRSDCIWQKPNAMPSSVKNRPTTDHEYVFFFTRSKDYYYNADAIREPHRTFSEDSKMKGGRKHFFQRGGTPEAGKNGGSHNLHDGRWDQAFHPLGRNKRTVWSIPLSKYRGAHFAVFPPQLVTNCVLATCPPGGVVLDPFAGSGTTAVVARYQGRKYLGIDCSKAYCALARQRLANEAKPKPKRTPR